MSISVLIPSYNLGRFLAEAIEGALEQGADEVVVSDNWSKDNTAEVAARYPQVRLIRPPHFMDLVAHHRFIVEQATTDWVAVVAADDRLRPPFIRACREVISQHPEVAWVTTGVRIFDEHSRVMRIEPGRPWRSGLRMPVTETEFLVDAFFPYYLSATMVRRDLALEMIDVAMKLDLKIIADVCIAFGIASRYPTYRLFGAFCDYRMLQTSTTRTNVARRYDECARVYDYFRKEWADDEALAIVADRFGEKVAWQCSMVTDIDTLPPERASRLRKLIASYPPVVHEIGLRQRLLSMLSRRASGLYTRLLPS